MVIAGPLALGAPPTPSGPVAYLGGDAQPSAFAGAFAEVLVFLPGLAPAADQKLTAYLKTRYAIA